MGRRKKHKMPPHVAADRMFVKMHRLDNMREQGGRCCYCNRKMTKHGFWCGQSATLEHKHSIHSKKRRRSDETNYAASCQRCNKLKGPMSDEEFRAEFDGFWELLLEYGDCKKCIKKQ